jgi:hypothetical protein
VDIISTETTRVEDNGMLYEVLYHTVKNKPENVANGGQQFYESVEVFRLKRDGTRGLKLKSINKRLVELCRAVRPK